MSFLELNKDSKTTTKEAATIYDAETINIVYETKKEIVEKLLPKPLEPFDQPLVRVYIADFPRTNFGEPYRESAMFLICKYKEEIGVYTLAMHVDNDMGMVLGRELFGYPKKMANIHFEKKGKQITAWSERHGIRYLEINAKLGMKIPEKLAIKNGLGANESNNVGFNFKHFIAPDFEGFDYKPRLIRQPIYTKRTDLINAKSTINLQYSENDPWSEVEVEKIVGSFYSKHTLSMLKSEVVAEVESEDFLSYAFLKWDKKNHE